jgi:hypothetical protein
LNPCPYRGVRLFGRGITTGPNIQVAMDILIVRENCGIKEKFNREKFTFHSCGILLKQRTTFLVCDTYLPCGFIL